MLLSIAVPVVQVLTESMPISSSGHVELLLCWWFGNNHFYVPSIKALYHLVHGLNAGIVIFYLRHHVRATIVSLAKGHIDPRIWVTWAATLITAILYIFVRSYIQCVPLPIGFSITVILLAFSRYLPGWPDRQYRWQDGVVLGLCQAIALIPGVSRFAVTVTTAQLIHLSPQQAFTISLYLQAPMMLGATILGIIQYSRLSASAVEEIAWWHSDAAWIGVVSMIVAVCCSFALLMFAQKLIVTRRLYYCAWYECGLLAASLIGLCI